MNVRRLAVLAAAAGIFAAGHLAQAEPKRPTGGKGASTDQAATMTAIALAESGGSSKKGKKKLSNKKKAPAKSKPVPTYKIENAWPSK